jgi:hypothetical protein
MTLRMLPMKSLIKGFVGKLGYEIRRIPEQPPWPPESQREAPRDEEAQFIGNVLMMSNQHYRPARLEYYRTVYGDDQRIKYIVYFLDLRQQRVLEIGPFEGHHSVILEKLGVRETISIESRDVNLEKCHRIKEKYRLEHTVFLKHDLERLYANREQPQFSGPFDLVFCLGVLYHVPDPVQALIWMRQQSKTLFLGTHVELKDDPGAVYAHRGKKYRGQWRKEVLVNPIHGMSPQSFVPDERDLIEMLRVAGYSNISVLGRDLHNNRPHVTILAE